MRSLEGYSPWSHSQTRLRMCLQAQHNGKSLRSNGKAALPHNNTQPTVYHVDILQTDRGSEGSSLCSFRPSCIRPCVRT
ncbi:hypothetical protein CapIbe_008358 [Capra ibex]